MTGAAEPVRKIIHCDCDCFYASVEMRDDPRLRGHPVAVGGTAEQRGVIAACNYEARAFGIHSAMPTAQAVKLCPNLILLPPQMEKYRAASRLIMAIYREYTELVEPLSLDEAYLDVTASPHCKGSATLIAQEIRERIFDTVGLPVSAGIAPNKFLAKVASAWNKPNGQFVVRPHEIDDFVAALPVKKLFGVGKVTAAKLGGLGYETCGDLRAASLPELQHHFGKFGLRLYQLSRGIDNRPVSVSDERKSVSCEESYTPDVPDLAACVARMDELLDALAARVKRCNAEGHIQKLYVKLRFADFTKTTVECVGTRQDRAQFMKLLETGYQRRAMPVRLLGAGVRLGPATTVEQGTLFDA
jgi:DNA polymerase-4